ncbi:hypothetical protein J2X20_004595 [Pelomonas saccharophila]|uniref:Uncharacterized protein n=1 Tax=Roseateles saccharophilus TaxID=304 RepID=A0ABU1YSV0_ROSSA|nr:hypothetical protein [Roseateles saccharophilus]MDR7271921.1 hypothetical protein [Roseateles saccharophilus]
MGVKKHGIWLLAIVLAIGASAAYYSLADDGYGKRDAVPTTNSHLRIPAAGEGALASNNLSSASSPESPGATPINPSRPPPLSPRRAIEVAQQSGLAHDAIVAARAIRTCQYMSGAGRKALDVVAERGVRKTPRPISELMAQLESTERACQELDASMIGQYEPMLRKAMEGGERGAAALWWLTPEAKALTSVSGESAALDLLRRDAMQCDLLSFPAYKVTAIRFPKSFDRNEVAAINAASVQLLKDRKLKTDRIEDLSRMFLAPSQALELGVDESVKNAKTVEILNSCPQGRSSRGR